MLKGQLRVYKSSKGAIITELDKLNGKNPMVLSYVKLPNTDLNGKPCTYEIVNGLITKIVVEDKIVHPLTIPKIVVQNQRPTNNSRFIDSLEISETCLPQASFKGLQQSIQNNGIDNFALKLNKAARYEIARNGTHKFLFFKNERRKDAINYCIQADYGDVNFEAIAKRHDNNAKNMLGFNQVKTFTMTVDWRLLQGLGIDSVYETGITLHHIYGIPYIPASAIKGIVRSWVIIAHFSTYASDGSSKIALDLKGAEDRAMQNSAFKNTFGTTEQSGKFIFFDAFPINTPTIEVDVMNPHYASYYSATKPPVDYDSPIPVMFLSIGKGTQFQFIIGTNEEKFEALLGKSIDTWLKDALSLHGIGAKTAVGYGYMNP